MKATRESNSKETVSNEKDWSLKQFLFLSSSLSSSLPQDLSLFSSRSLSYFWQKLINSISENESSTLLPQTGELGFLITKWMWETLIIKLLLFIFLFSNNYEWMKHLEWLLLNRFKFYVFVGVFLVQMGTAEITATPFMQTAECFLCPAMLQHTANSACQLFGAKLVACSVFLCAPSDRKHCLFGLSLCFIRPELIS